MQRASYIVLFIAMLVLGGCKKESAEINREFASFFGPRIDYFSDREELAAAFRSWPRSKFVEYFSHRQIPGGKAVIKDNGSIVFIDITFERDWQGKGIAREVCSFGFKYDDAGRLLWARYAGGSVVVP